MKRCYSGVLVLMIMVGCSEDGAHKPLDGTLGFGDQDTENASLYDSEEGSDSFGVTDADADSDGDGDGDSDVIRDTETGVMIDTETTAADTDSIDTGLTLQHCLERTPDEDTCRACCDCKTDGCTDRATCRDTCTAVDYHKNSEYVSFETPSTIGNSGDYLDCFMRGEEQACKQCCDCSVIYACGDYPYCRTVCETIF